MAEEKKVEMAEPKNEPKIKTVDKAKFRARKLKVINEMEDQGKARALANLVIQATK